MTQRTKVQEDETDPNYIGGGDETASSESLDNGQWNRENVFGREDSVMRA